MQLPKHKTYSSLSLKDIMSVDECSADSQKKNM